MNGNMSKSYVRGCSIHDTHNRAINIHNSHNILLQNNVVYNAKGGAIFLEDSIETGLIPFFTLAGMGRVMYNFLIAVYKETHIQYCTYIP